MKATGSTRTRLWLIAITTVVIAASSPRAGRSEDAVPCGARASQAATTDPGLQVQVDPETGTYSMPAPGTLAAPAPQNRAAAAEDLVVTPGTSPAGGFKATLGTESLLRKGQE